MLENIIKSAAAEYLAPSLIDTIFADNPGCNWDSYSDAESTLSDYLADDLAQAIVEDAMARACIVDKRQATEKVNRMCEHISGDIAVSEDAIEVTELYNYASGYLGALRDLGLLPNYEANDRLAGIQTVTGTPNDYLRASVDLVLLSLKNATDKGIELQGAQSKAVMDEIAALDAFYNAGLISYVRRKERLERIESDQLYAAENPPELRWDPEIVILDEEGF